MSNTEARKNKPSSVTSGDSLSHFGSKEVTRTEFRNICTQMKQMAINFTDLSKKMDRIYELMVFEFKQFRKDLNKVNIPTTVETKKDSFSALEDSDSSVSNDSDDVKFVKSIPPLTQKFLSTDDSSSNSSISFNFISPTPKKKRKLEYKLNKAKQHYGFNDIKEKKRNKVCKRDNSSPCETAFFYKKKRRVFDGHCLNANLRFYSYIK